MNNCLQLALNNYLRIECPSFVELYDEQWLVELDKWCIENSLGLIVYDYCDDWMPKDGIGIYWTKNKTSTHAVVLRCGKVDYNPDDRTLGQLREVLVIEKQLGFPPRTEKNT